MLCCAWQGRPGQGRAGQGPFSLPWHAPPCPHVAQLDLSDIALKDDGLRVVAGIIRVNETIQTLVLR